MGSKRSYDMLWPCEFDWFNTNKDMPRIENIECNEILRAQDTIYDLYTIEKPIQKRLTNQGLSFGGGLVGLGPISFVHLPV